MDIFKLLRAKKVKRIGVFLTFTLFFWMFLSVVQVEDVHVAGSEHTKIKSSEVSIFDIEPGSQEYAQALDIFSSFLVGGVIGTGSLYLAYPSSYGGVSGTDVTLTGGGFSTSGNIVYFGNRAIKNVPSPTGTTLVFTVPDVVRGEYIISVSNGKNVIGGVSFFVYDIENAPPVIDFIFPTSGFGETEVTIHGSGFSTTKGNTVLTGYGVVYDVLSPDGVTLKVSMLPPNYDGDIKQFSNAKIDDAFDALESKGADQGLITDVGEEMWVYVSGENGLSNPAVYTYFYDKTTF